MENNENKLPSQGNAGETENTTFDIIDEKASSDIETSSEADDVTEENIIRADNNYDADMWITTEEVPQKPANKLVRGLYDFVEMLAIVTIAIVLSFAFIFRLNIVEGPSMNETLHTGEYLVVSDLFYKPTPGDIVVIHDLTAGRYAEPIVKRIIAVEGDVVNIDFDTWTLTVNGEKVDESSYRYLAHNYPQNTSDYVKFPLTVKEGHVFVMGDNRYYSADSRLEEIGQIDERCVVGKVYARVFPIEKFTMFKNPYTEQ